MAILDQVIQMQGEGKENPEILRVLQEQGISAKEVSDAINQAQIKNALTTQENKMEQQSIMTDNSTVPEATPQASQPVAQEEYYAQTPQGYDQNYTEGEYGQGTVDPDTISEIAKQVVDEEFKAFEKKTGNLASFKNSTESNMENIEERLKRIEQIIDKLQQSVIQKIGEFGENTNYIRKDLENLHNTTSKLMNPLIDSLNAKKKSSKKKSKK
jgi:hypothetical protein